MATWIGIGCAGAATRTSCQTPSYTGPDQAGITRSLTLPVKASDRSLGDDATGSFGGDGRQWLGRSWYPTLLAWLDG